jgi:hypothetical protein
LEEHINLYEIVFTTIHIMYNKNMKIFYHEFSTSGPDNIIACCVLLNANIFIALMFIVHVVVLIDIISL